MAVSQRCTWGNTLPVSGASPFGLGDAQRLAPPLSEKVPTIAGIVERVVMRALAIEPAQRFPNIQAFAEALEEASKESPQIATTTRRSSAPLEGLAPTIKVSPPSQRQQQTEKAVQFNRLSPAQTEVVHPPPDWPLARAADNSMRRPSFVNRLQVALNVGGIAGLLGALLQMVLALWNAPSLQVAGKQIAEHKLTIAVALSLLGVEAGTLLIGLLAAFTGGTIAGKLARRNTGSLTGMIVGITLYLVTFFVSYLPQYPVNTTVRGMGAGLAGGSLVLSVVFLCLWAALSGFVGFLGAGMTSGK